MSTMRAAKTIWDACGGRVSNLSMQKLLYLSHMMEIGAGHGPLASREFEAWDYGPVEPDLYHKLKAYGSGPVPDIFNAEPYMPGDSEYASISEVIRQVGNAGARRLVAITHWDGGAWSKHYSSGRRGIVIPNADIFAEYQSRVARSAAKAS